MLSTSIPYYRQQGRARQVRLRLPCHKGTTPEGKSAVANRSRGDLTHVVFDLKLTRKLQWTLSASCWQQSALGFMFWQWRVRRSERLSFRENENPNLAHGFTWQLPSTLARAHGTSKLLGFSFDLKLSPWLCCTHHCQIAKHDHWYTLQPMKRA